MSEQRQRSKDTPPRVFSSIRAGFPTRLSLFPPVAVDRFPPGDTARPTASYRHSPHEERFSSKLSSPRRPAQAGRFGLMLPSFYKVGPTATAARSVPPAPSAFPFRLDMFSKNYVILLYYINYKQKEQASYSKGRPLHVRFPWLMSGDGRGEHRAERPFPSGRAFFPPVFPATFPLKRASCTRTHTPGLTKTSWT